MEDKYIGVKEKTEKSPFGNLGRIFELKEDGNYHLLNSKIPYVLSKSDIQSDFSKGYLEKYS